MEAGTPGDVILLIADDGVELLPRVYRVGQVLPNAEQVTCHPSSDARR